MNTKTAKSTRRPLIAAIVVVALVGAWWLFRPEKLWVNQKVSEAAPFSTGNQPQPLFTGDFSGNAHPTTGRATIFQKPDSKKYLRLTNFSTSNGPAVHVILVRTGDKALTSPAVSGKLDDIDLGALKGNQGDQNYDIPASADLTKYQSVAVYCTRFHVVFGAAELDSF